MKRICLSIHNSRSKATILTKMMVNKCIIFAYHIIMSLRGLGVKTNAKQLSNHNIIEQNAINRLSWVTFRKYSATFV